MIMHVREKHARAFPGTRNYDVHWTRKSEEGAADASVDEGKVSRR